VPNSHIISHLAQQRLQVCFLPTHCNASAFLPLSETYPFGPQLYIFRGSIQSLHPCSIQLRTPVTGSARRLH